MSRPNPGGGIVWLTGLSGAGKSTIARIVAEQLCQDGVAVEWLDGDAMRERLGRRLGFSRDGRDENVRRIAWVAGLLSKHGVTVLVSAISPYRSVRDEIRRSRPAFIEVYVNAPLSSCEARDVKGLYRRARAGEIRQFTGVDDPYEAPLAPDVECHTDIETPAESARTVMQAIMARSAPREFWAAAP